MVIHTPMTLEQNWPRSRYTEHVTNKIESDIDNPANSSGTIITQ